MSSAALFRILFWPRLEPLGWFFFESRRAAGAKNRLPQAVRCENTMKESGAIVCKKAQHFNERHKGCITHLKGKIASSRLGSSPIPCRQRPFFSCR
jgi:hypothetical protein